MKYSQLYTELQDMMDITPSVPGGLYSTGPGIQVTERTFTTQPADQSAPYPAPAAARAIAMALERPGHTIAGVSALAAFGLPYLVDSCCTTLYGPVSKVKPPTTFSPRVQRTPSVKPWYVFFQGTPLAISRPADALVNALILVRNGTHSWQTEYIKNLSSVDVQAIQLIDASRRFLGIAPEDILCASRGKLSRKWITHMLELSSNKAESPKETEMRLLCREVCREFNVELTEQLPIWTERRLLTTFDLAIPDLKIALMYDGSPHLNPAQRDVDARVNIEATLLGWTVLRVTAGTLSQTIDYLRLIITSSSQAA